MHAWSKKAIQNLATLYMTLNLPFRWVDNPFPTLHVQLGPVFAADFRNWQLARFVTAPDSSPLSSWTRGRSTLPRHRRSAAFASPAPSCWTRGARQPVVTNHWFRKTVQKLYLILILKARCDILLQLFGGKRLKFWIGIFLYFLTKCNNSLMKWTLGLS